MEYAINFAGLVTYKGAVNTEGNPHGRGQLFYDGTLVYDGEFLSGKKHGQGAMYWEDGSLRHFGKFQYGKRESNPLEGVEVQYKITLFHHETNVCMYSGGYWLGVYQGYGELYDRSGKLLYKGLWDSGNKLYENMEILSVTGLGTHIGNRSYDPTDEESGADQAGGLVLNSPEERPVQESKECESETAKLREEVATLTDMVDSLRLKYEEMQDKNNGLLKDIEGLETKMKAASQQRDVYKQQCVTMQQQCRSIINSRLLEVRENKRKNLELFGKLTDFSIDIAMKVDLSYDINDLCDFDKLFEMISVKYPDVGEAAIAIRLARRELESNSNVMVRTEYVKPLIESVETLCNRFGVTNSLGAFLDGVVGVVKKI